MSGQDELRERIARALWEHAGVRYVKGQLFCTCGLLLWHPETGFYSDRVKKQIDQPLSEAAQSQHHADAVIAALGLRQEWDGEGAFWRTPWERIEEDE